MQDQQQRDHELAVQMAEVERILPAVPGRNSAPQQVVAPPGGAPPAPTPAGPYSAWNNSLCGEGKRYSSKCGCCTFCFLFILCVLLLVIILPLSVVRVSYDAYGLPKRRSTAVVLSGPGDLWDNGPHWAGPDFTYQSIPSRIQMENIEMAPFVKGSGNELPVKFQIFWRQDPDFMDTNFLRFGDHSAVRTRLTTQLEVAVKGLSASTFTLNDYISNLEVVRQGYIKAIQSAIEGTGIGIIIHGLYFTHVTLPSQVVESSLQSAILSEDEVIKVIEGKAILTRAETTMLTKYIQSQTKLMNTQGTAESAAIVAVAKAEAAARISGAEGLGLAKFFDALNVTALSQKAAWQKYLAILRKKDATP